MRKRTLRIISVLNYKYLERISFIIVFFILTTFNVLSQEEFYNKIIPYAGYQNGVHVKASGEISYKKSTIGGHPHIIYKFTNLKVDEIRFNNHSVFNSSNTSLIPFDVTHRSNKVKIRSTFESVGFLSREVDCVNGCSVYFEEFTEEYKNIESSKKEEVRANWFRSSNVNIEIKKIDEEAIQSLLNDILRNSSAGSSNTNNSTSKEDLTQNSKGTNEETTEQINDKQMGSDREKQSVEQNQSNNSKDHKKTAEEVQREQIQRQQERISNNSNNSSQNSNTNNQAQKKAEQNHESQRKKQSELSNNQQQEVASRSHNEALAELGVAAILVHLAVGYTIYNTIGDVVGSENTYRGNGTHHQLNVGYGLSYYNMSINNVSESPFMINLGATYHLNLVQGDNFGIGIRTDLEAGHSILLDRRLEYGFGGNIYLGHKNIRLFTELQYFNNNITFAKSNVTNSNIDKYSLKWRGHRLSLGPLFSWNGNMNHIKILYNWNYLKLPTKWNEKSDNLLFPTSNGVRVEYLKRNHFQFYAQYNNLVNNPSISPSSSFYTSSNGASTGGLYSIGIRRTWDWHKKGALDNSLEKIRKQNFSDKNTYLSILNPIIEWGSLQRGQDEFLLDGPQLSFNLISAEKQFSISKNFVGLLGLGISSLRRVSGVVSYAERTSLDQFTITNPYNGELLPVSFTPIDPEWGVAYKTKQINRFSPFDFELPIGVQYFFSGTYSDRYWAAAKLSPVFSFGELGEDMRHYEGDIFKSFHMIYRLGVGVDLPRLMNQNLRFGIYYFTRSNTIDLDNVTQHINGVQFQMALGF